MKYIKSASIKEKESKKIETENQERIIQAYKDHLKHAKMNWKEIKREKIIWEETAQENEEDEKKPNKSNKVTSL